MRRKYKLPFIILEQNKSIRNQILKLHFHTIVKLLKKNNQQRVTKIKVNKLTVCF